MTGNELCSNVTPHPLVGIIIQWRRMARVSVILYLKLYSYAVADPGIGRGGGGGGGGGHRRGCGKGWGEVVGGGSPGRVREGGTPPAQLGGVGERCKLPHQGLGRSPRSQRFLRRKPPKKYVKTALKM